MKHKNALLLIDIQHDFMPNGRLPVTHGDLVVPVANAAMQSTKKRGELVCASLDWHPKDHGSFAVTQGVPEHTDGMLGDIPQHFWPRHCVQGTWGAAYHRDLDTDLIDAQVLKGMRHHVDSYSAFRDNDRKTETGLHELLQSHGITHVTIMGLATDFCVKASVEDASAFGYHVLVVKAGCRAVFPDREEEVWDHLLTLPNVQLL